MHLAAVACGLLILGSAAPALAQPDAFARPNAEARAPNFLGATGLLLAPSAHVQRDREVSIVAAGNARFVAGGAVVGVGNRMELGAAVLDSGDEFAAGETELLANARLNLFPETLIRPAFSVGVSDALDALDLGPGWYLVTSKTIIPYFVRAVAGREAALKLHLGYGGGIYDEEPFAGLELFGPGSLSGMAEVVHGRVNLGARFFRRGLCVTAGLFALDHGGGSISYSLPLR